VSLIDERQEYHRLQAAEAREAGRRRTGLAVEVLFADNNAVLQIQQAFRHVHAPEAERPLAILVQSVTGEGLERVARNAVRAGIGWIVLNRRVPYIEELRQLRPDLAIAAVTPDQEAIGRIHARQIRALAPGGGPVLYVQGPADTSAAQDRLRATQEALAGEPFHWKVVNGDWSEASGERAVAGWLRLKTAEGQRPQLLVAQNDAMAAGARRAAVAHNVEWRRVPVIGCDGLPASAGAAVELVARWLRDGKAPPPEVVLVPEPYPRADRAADV
jgi:ABC-type sugar transport system substrate-binding protein